MRPLYDHRPCAQQGAAELGTSFDVQRAKGVALVFVKLAPDHYEARRVKLGLTQGELVEVVEGVKAGEAVATRGSFLLKTETLKGAIGAGCCDVE